VQTYEAAYRVGGYDFTSYRLSASALWNGENPYKTETDFTYIYPLFLAFLLMPLAAVPYWLANFIWFGLGAAALFFSCKILLTLASDDIFAIPNKRYLLSAVAIVLIMFSPIQNNFRNGQVNPIVLFCCVMFLERFTRGKKTSAALWLGGAIALKIVPAILLAFLLIRRQWRIMFLTALFTALFCLLPIVVTGSKLFSYYYEYWNWFFCHRLWAMCRKMKCSSDCAVPWNILFRPLIPSCG
jgi:hypothetical protein